MPNTPKDTGTFRGTLLLFLVLFVSVGALLAGLMTAFHQAEVSSHVDSVRLQETFAVELQRRLMTRAFGDIVADALVLAEQDDLCSCLDSGDIALAHVQSEYLNWAGIKKIYDQIRFLDSDGMERVRVNHRDGRTWATPKAELQDKSDRYYFKDAMRLGKGRIYVSPFDLNVENGRVEEPYRPMIRIGTPVFDTMGRKRGAVIINYQGQDLLDRITDNKGIALGESMLLNADGYWLLAPDENDAWGFMFPDRRGRTFASRHPLAWEAMNRMPSGQLLTDQGLFTFATVHPLRLEFRSGTGQGDAGSLVQGEQYHWIVASHIPTDVFDAFSRNLLGRLLLFGAALLVVLAAGAWFLARATVRRRLYQTRMETMAHFDALTGLPNRALFFDRLGMVLEGAARHERTFAVLFADLDGFKQVNDTMGHDAGDEVLVAMAGRLRACIRKSDTVARLGGDEFAIVLADITGPDDVRRVSEKIIAAVAEPVDVSSGQARLGVSLGGALYPEHADTVETLLQSADTAMYVSKRKGKNTWTLAGSPAYTADHSPS